MNGVQTRFKCKLDVKRCKRFVFPPSSLLPRSNALKTKAIRYFQTDRTLTRIVSPPLLTALLPNKEGKLLAGMSGKASLNTHSVSTLSQGAAIPQTALCHRPTEGDYLWVVNSKTQQVTKRKVKKGDLLPNGYVSITEGLYPDETVANSGLRFLSDGMKISVENE